MPLISKQDHEGMVGRFSMGILQEKSATPLLPRRPDEAGIFQVLGAAFQQENLLVSSASFAMTGGLSSHDPEFGYSILKDPQLKGFDQHLDHFSGSQSRAETSDIKSRLQTQLNSRRVLEEAGWGGIAAAGFAAILSPENLLVVGAISKLSKAGRLSSLTKTSISNDILLGTAVNAAGEAGLSFTQDLRTGRESILNVAGGAVLIGVLGSTIRGLQKSGAAAAEVIDTIERKSLETQIGKEIADLENGGLAAIDTIEIRGMKEMPEDGLSPSVGAARVEPIRPVIDPKTNEVTLRSDDPEVQAWIDAIPEDMLRPELLHEGGQAAFRKNNPGADVPELPWLGKVAAQAIRSIETKMLFNRGSAGGAMRALAMRMVDTAILFKGERPKGQSAEAFIARGKTFIAGRHAMIKDHWKEHKTSGGEHKTQQEFESAMFGVIHQGEGFSSSPQVRAAAAEMTEIKNMVSESAVERGFISSEDIVDMTRIWDRSNVHKDNRGLVNLIKKSLVEEERAANRAKAIQSVKDELDDGVEFDLSDAATAAEVNKRALDLPVSPQDELVKHTFNIIGHMQGLTNGNSLAGISPVTSPFRSRRLPLSDAELSSVGALSTKLDDYTSKYANDMLPRIELARAGDMSNMTTNMLRMRREIDDLREDIRRGNEVDPTDIQRLEGILHDMPFVRALSNSALATHRESATTLRNLLSVREDLVDGLRREGLDEEAAIKLREDLATNQKAIDFIKKEAKSLDGAEPSGNFRRVLYVDEESMENAVERLHVINSNLLRQQAEESSSLVHVINDVKHQHSVKLDKAKAEGDAKKVKSLEKQLKQDLNDIDTLRARMLGQIMGGDQPHEEMFKNISWGFRTLNYVRFGGGFVLSSFPDMAMHVFVNGLPQTWRTLKAAMSDKRIFKGSRTELQRNVAQLELVTGSRSTLMADMAELPATNKVGKALTYLRDATGVVSLINHWNAFHKGFASINTADKILQVARKVSEGKALTKSERNAIELEGFSHDMLRRIHKQNDLHGERVVEGGTEKILLAHSDRWLKTDRGAAEAFEAAVIAEVNRTIITPGAGSTPRWFSSSMGAMFGQFKSFAWTGSSKILLSGMSRMDQNVASGAISLMSMGIMTQILKDSFNNRKESPTGTKLILNGIDRSGIGGIFSEFVNIGLKAAEPLGVSSAERFRSRNLASAVAGPSMGTFFDISQVFGALTGKLAGKEFTDADINTARKLLPWHTLFYLRNVFNNVENSFRNNPVENPALLPSIEFEDVQ